MQAHYDVLANLRLPYFQIGESGRSLKKIVINSDLQKKIFTSNRKLQDILVSQAGHQNKASNQAYGNPMQTVMFIVQQNTLSKL